MRGDQTARLGFCLTQSAFDEEFEPLFLAYVVGLVRLGLGIHVTFTVQGQNRLSKIIGPIEKSEYSIHDLSRIESTKGTPRFNMPLELGLALHRSHATRGLRHPHQVYVFESKRFRAQQSTSDVNGMDPQIHGGTPDGVMRELRNLFSQPEQRVSARQMMASYRAVALKLTRLREEAGGGSLFEKALFEDVVLAASTQYQRPKSTPTQARRSRADNRKA